MAPGEVELFDAREMRRLEPNVLCTGAVLSRTDSSVDYRAFTEALGVTFLTGANVREIRADEDILEVFLEGGTEPIVTRFLVNCAGGGALDIAQAMRVGLEYSDLHFRGEYWVVGGVATNLCNRNVYSVPRHKDMPFLDPHWIVRANGRREIGPNAVPVSSPWAYDGLIRPVRAWFDKLLEPPVRNKVRLLLNPEFVGLAAGEMLSSISKAEMLGRVQKFLPALKERHLIARGTAGVRSQIVDRNGQLAQEAIEVPGRHSYNILNYNSPGATGAPAYAAYLVDRIASRGDLDHLKKNPKPQKIWDWATVAKAMGLAG